MSDSLTGGFGASSSALNWLTLGMNAKCTQSSAVDRYNFGYHALPNGFGQRIRHRPLPYGNASMDNT